MPPVTLSPAAEDQVEAVNRVIVAAKNSWDYDEDYLRAAIPLVQVDARYIAENLCFVAQSGGEVVAFGAVEIHDGQPGVLEHLWVAPERQRQGIGAALLRQLCESARGAGCQYLKIASDPPAVGFYTRLGAVVVDEVASRVPEGPRFPVLHLSLAETMTPLAIRVVGPNDADRAHALLGSMYPEVKQADYERRLARMRAEDGYELVGCYENDALLGVAGFIRLTNLIYDAYIWVHDLVIDEAQRGRGLGTRLMEHIHELARSEGRSYVALAAHVSDHDAQRFYEKHLGYERRAVFYRQPISEQER